jgi:hypothetical protein
MNLAHVHILLNHFPTVGFGVGLCLLFVALFGKSDDLKRASLVVFVVIALLAIPTYLSGNAAQQVIVGGEDVSEALIKTHQDAALPAFLFMEITGALAWLALWQFRQISRPARWNLSAVLLLSIVTFFLIARAATIGGEIRHPEMGAVASDTERLKSVSIVASFVIDHPWVWPACETFHFIGLCLLFGVVLLVNLGMLGIIKDVSFVALHRLLPWGILGFGINFITGMLFFIANPGQYTQNVAFYWKMVLLLLAGTNLLYITVFDEDHGPLPAKVIAATSIFLWIGVIFFGRMLPYIGSE